jgi:membrane protein
MEPSLRFGLARLFLGGERGDGEAVFLEASWPERGRRAWRFLRFLVSKSGEDAITLKAAALAFVTILSLVPLLAAFSFVGARVLTTYRDRILETLAGVLPYSEATILDSLQEFVVQAETLQRGGTLVFILVSLGAFLTIEETLNKIWLVGEKRTLRAKLLSFTLLLFWGPLVLGSSLSFLVLVRQRPGLDVLFEEAFVVQALPFLVGALALTMLYWQVPNTAVKFRSALAGGIAAAILLEILRSTFGYYVDNLTQMNVVVYGSFALAIFFMVSVQLAWFAVLLGCEIAYVSQHFTGLTRSTQLDLRFRGPWIGLAVAIELARGLRTGRPITTDEELATRLQVRGDAIRDALEPLEKARIVQRGRDDEDQEGFLLCRDPHQVTVREVLRTFDPAVERLLAGLESGAGSSLRELDREIRARRDDQLGDRTLVDLLAEPASAES